MVSSNHSFWKSAFLAIMLNPGAILSIQAQPQGGIRTTDIANWNQDEQVISTNLADGVLTLGAEGSAGTLVSPDPYSDFRCRFEIQIDSLPGAFFQFRTTANGDLDRGYRISLNHQLETQWPLGSIENFARANWIEDLERADWTEVLIVVVGDLLQVMLDGSKVAEVHEYNVYEGFLAFHLPAGAKITLRNFALKPMEASSPSLHSLESLMEQDQSAKTISLFDGTSLDGWTPVGQATWIIQEGVLHAYSGKQGGFLVSDFAAKNFHLTLSFKIAKEHNSGIFIRKPVSDTLPTLQNSLECNIYDHNGFSHLYSTGSIATHARAPMGLVDFDEWNRMEIFAYEDHVCIYINDRKACEAHLPAFNHAGNICIQGGIQIFSEGQPPSHIQFRDISVRDFSGILLPVQH